MGNCRSTQNSSGTNGIDQNGTQLRSRENRREFQENQRNFRENPLESKEDQLLSSEDQPVSRDNRQILSVEGEESRSTLRSIRRLATRRRLTSNGPMSSSDTTIPLPSRRTTQKFILVWLDSTVDGSDANYLESLFPLKELVSTLKIFSDADECVRFLTQVVNDKILIILSDFDGECLMPLVHDMDQIDSIYVRSANVREPGTWTNKWPKVMGIFTEIISICEILEQILSPAQNSTTPRSIPVSEEHYLSLGFLALDDDVQMENLNLDELDPSFIFTKVLKEILLELQYNKEKSMNELVAFCRSQFAENDQELANTDDFSRDYRSEAAIWWYTRESFLYRMLNRALRILEADTIITMGFFVRDLHEQIVQLDSKQRISHDSGPFVVYRGQTLTLQDFIRMRKSKGGLISFNNFLSTSRDMSVASHFARSASHQKGFVGILFVMHIDPLQSSTPFADVTESSYYNRESEVLFSMHSVFRINSIKHSNIHDCWEVNLTITSVRDQENNILTERLREETQGSSGWDRMGKLLIKLGMYYNAERTYKVLLEQITTDTEGAHYYHQLGYIKEDLGEYDDALSFYEKSLEIKQKDSTPDRSDFAMYYNNVGSVYDKKGDFTTAVSFFKMAIDIFQQILRPNHPRLAICYNNIGSAYRNMREFSLALCYYEQVLEIDIKCLPPTDSSLGVDYNNIGLVYYDMREYNKALSCFEKTLDIYNRALQSGHADFSEIYSSIGSVYISMEEYSKALSFYQKAFEIDKKTLPSNHPYLGVSYNNIGSIYKQMEEYAEALSMFERALNIENSSQSPDPARLQLYKKNIEFAKEKQQ